MRARYYAAVATGLLGCIAGCGDDGKTTTKGELIVALQTDMELPKDVDKVRIRVASYGSTIFSNDYKVGPPVTNDNVTKLLQAARATTLTRA